MLARLLILLFALPVFAAEMKGMKFDDTMKVDGKELKLNPLGVRKVTRFGLPISVYVGGFYLPKKICDREEMLKVERPVVLRQVYLLNAPLKELKEGWESAITDNCEKDCDKAKEGIKEFLGLLGEPRNGTIVTMKITKDSVEVDDQGKFEKEKPKNMTVKNAAFATAMLYTFFGKNPPDERFQRQLLCGER